MAPIIAAAAPPEPGDDADASPALGERSLMGAAYIYLPDITGSAALGPVQSELAVPARELLGGAKSGFMGYLRHNRGAQFVYLEAIAMRFGEKSFEPFFGLPVASSLNFVETGMGRDWLSDNGRWRMSGYGGLRYLDLDIAVTPAGALMEATERGVDVTTGVSVEGQLTRRWTLAIKADVAGAGTSRRDYRSVAALAGTRLSRDWQLYGGWRWATLETRPSASGLSLDIEGRGPQLGVLYTR